MESLLTLLPLFDSGSGTFYDLRHLTMHTAPKVFLFVLVLECVFVFVLVIRVCICICICTCIKMCICICTFTTLQHQISIFTDCPMGLPRHAHQPAAHSRHCGGEKCFSDPQVLIFASFLDLSTWSWDNPVQNFYFTFVVSQDNSRTLARLHGRSEGFP